MENWPTDRTLLLLLLGAAPLVFVFWKSFFGERAEGLTLRFWMVTLTWSAFHASAFGHLVLGMDWNGSDSPISYGYVDTALAHTALAMIVFLFASWSPGRRGQGETSHAALMQVRVPPWVLWVSLLGFCLLTPVRAGGLSELIHSFEHRGEFQWMTRDVWWWARWAATVLTTMGSTIIAVLASLSLVQDRRNDQASKWIGWAVTMVILMIPGAHNFSRITGLPLIVAGVVIGNAPTRRSTLAAAGAIMVGVLICLVALSQRPNHDQGLSPFCVAMSKGIDFRGPHHESWFDLGMANPVRACERFTVVAEIRDVTGSRTTGDVVQFFLNCQPLPSLVVPVRAIVEPLAAYLHYNDHTQLPVPFLAEAYYVFGFAGVVLMIPLGIAYSLFEERRVRAPGVASSIAYFLCLASIGVSTHDTSRPVTRFLLYAAVVVGVAGGSAVAQPGRRRHPHRPVRPPHARPTVRPTADSAPGADLLERVVDRRQRRRIRSSPAAVRPDG